MAAADLLVGILAVTCGALVGRLGDMPGLRWSKPLYVVVVTCSAVGGGMAVTHATGWGPADAAWRIFLVVTLTIAASRANPASLLVAAVVVVAIAQPGTAWLGLAALGVVVATSVPAVRAIAGGLLGIGLLHADWPGGRGATAAVAAAVLLLVVLSTDRRFIRQAVVVGVGLVGVSILASAAAGVALARQRDAAIRAVDAGQLGLDAAREGRSADAQVQFERTAELLRRVDATLGRWPAQGALAVPVVGANLDGVRSLVDIARDIASSGAAAARSADVDQITPHDGAVDLASLRSFSRPLATLDATLTEARGRLAALRSPWAISPLSSRTNDLAERVARAQRDARRARRAVDTVPDLLGGSGRRRYFLAVMTPSELRGGGGFVGNWGILQADAGVLTLPRFGRIGELYPETAYRIAVDPEYDDRYVRGWALGMYPGNILASPDLTSDALAVNQILSAAGEGEVDGIVAIDPHGMAALLQLTGPIDVQGWSRPLDSTNVAEALLFEQYRDAADDPQRPELLARTTQSLFTRLTTGSLPGAEALSKTLGPVVAAGHLQFGSVHASDQALLIDLGLQHQLDPPTPDSDTLRVIGQNAAQSKLDWFLRRSITYEVNVTPSGQVEGHATIEIQNTTPRTGLRGSNFQDSFDGLPFGVDVQAISVYTPLTTTGVKLDGAPVEFGHTTEKGHNVYDRFVTLAPGATSVLRYDLKGRIRPSQGWYRLRIHPQPTATPDHLRVIVNGRTLFDGSLTRDLLLRRRLR